MKRLLIVIFLCNIFFIFAQEEQHVLPSVAIVAPYMSNDNTFTEFFNRQFAFEFFSTNTVAYQFDILHTDYDDNSDITLEQYLELSKEQAFEQNYDYLIFSKVFTIDNSLYDNNNDKTNLVFKYQLIDLSSNKIIKSAVYNLDHNNTLNDILSYISKKIIYDLNNVNLVITKKESKKIIEKNKKEKEQKEEEIYEEEIKKERKHEIFVQNGFLKTTPRMLSFFSYSIGYSFIPYKFFDFGGTIFLGVGNYEDKIDFSKIDFDNFYVGTSTGINFFLPGFVVEPSIGAKVEISYVVNKYLDLYIPIDMGFKFNLHKDNFLKINLDFQFTTFNIFENQWQNNYLISVWIGYAKKI